MSTTYPDLTGTSYPDALDIALPFTAASRDATGWKNNVDGQDYVLASDVNILQDAILALQGIVGIKDIDVINAETLNVISRLKKIKTDMAADALALTNHAHTGEAGKPTLVSLANHVTGTLPVTNIKTSGLGCINATNVFVGSDGSGLSISVSLSNKLDRATGGSVTGNISVTGQFISSIAIGSAPLVVTSTTLVTNLNADLLDGKQGNEYATLVGAETFTNKTLTSPKINENVILTPTSTELNYVKGVTSAIQNQFTGKADLVGGKVPQSQLTNPGGSLVSATAPANTSILWIDTTSGGILKYHNGTDWVQAKYAYV
jgi:hypothetical protein